MKKTIITLSTSLLLLTFSCNKSTEGNKGVIKKENGYSENLPKDSLSVTENAGNKTAQEYTERYVAEDGSSALVTFKNTDKEKSISIRSNNKTISAPEKKKTSDGTIYGNYDFEIMAKTDSITITQGNNIIKLKKARGQ
ncbi:hypothetical protein IV494_13265 [Kaistella sp. G5-32]|uniref:Lipoprotein n=1 Tax=Kaistella gelatinilytica TaxID=2787636 RepID=A0ABS0FEP8_9FLAO|nr:hypothetical protein [Kaistella gelatinilytica]MBF8458147.1 hypothetical protein [Kaistella gelatinilytica]